MLFNNDEDKDEDEETPTVEDDEALFRETDVEEESGAIAVSKKG